MMNKLILIIVLFGASICGYSQTDSIRVQEKKNIIRWNMTPMFVIGPKSFVVGYQRVLEKGRSFSINAGYLELKPLTKKDGTVIKVFDESKRGGYDLAADFRFYFKNRNKYPAPDGLYWGPFAAIYNFNFEGKSEIFEDGIENTIGYKSNINMYSVGVQLGYQFIIKKRLSVDLILFGPSYTHYDFSMKFDSKIALDPNSQFYQDMKEILSTVIPGSEVILDGVDFSQGGRVKLNSFGFRYGIQVGYVF